MKILLLTTLMDIGGAQKAILQLARGLKERGHSVTVAALYDRINILAYFEGVYGIEIIDLRMRRHGTANPILVAYALIRGLWHMYWCMRRGNYDVLQTFCLYGNMMGMCIGALARIPIRISSQRNRLDDYSLPIRLLDRAIANLPMTKCMVAVCESNRQYCISSLGIRSNKLVTIVNGVAVTSACDAAENARRLALREQLGIDPGCIIAAVVARLRPQKGHRHLLEAVRRLKMELPTIRVLMVGDGPLHRELGSLIERYGLLNYVHMLGARKDVEDILAISDIFVLPSLWEGLPNAVLEAMAAGLPVIATNVDGTSEVVVDGETGILVPPGDANALSQAICDLALNADRRRAMGDAGRTRAEREFSFTKFVERFEGLYRQLAVSAKIAAPLG